MRTRVVLMERRAKRKNSPVPPLVNKARYKFLGLNLDYSIDKARRVLRYNPKYSTEEGLNEAMAEVISKPVETPRPVAVS